MRRCAVGEDVQVFARLIHSKSKGESDTCIQPDGEFPQICGKYIFCGSQNVCQNKCMEVSPYVTSQQQQ